MDLLNIKEKDLYVVVTKSVITDYDRKLLVKLYQPLCGVGPVALYFSLWSELEYDKTISSGLRPHSVLLKMLKCDMGSFVSYRHQLEALGLIKTYKHDEGYYIFELYAPKKPREFFDYDLFDAVLQKQLGEDEYKRVFNYFMLSNIDMEKTCNISQTFPEVFNINFKELDYVHNDVISLISEVSCYPETSFDFQAFYLSLKDYQIKKTIITKVVEKELPILATTYNITPKDMASIVQRSLDNDGKINLQQLKDIARRRAAAPVLKEKEEVKEIKTGNLSLDERISLYNGYTPVEFLKVKSGNVNPLPADCRKINELVNLTNLPIPVINVIIDYCLEKDNNSLYKNNLETVAGRLIRSKVATAYDAFMFLYEGKATNKKVSSPKAEKVAEKPEENVSDEDILNAMKKLKDLSGKRD